MPRDHREFGKVRLDRVSNVFLSRLQKARHDQAEKCSNGSSWASRHGPYSVGSGHRLGRGFASSRNPTAERQQVEAGQTRRINFFNLHSLVCLERTQHCLGRNIPIPMDPDSRKGEFLNSGSCSARDGDRCQCDKRLLFLVRPGILQSAFKFSGADDAADFYASNATAGRHHNGLVLFHLGVKDIRRTGRLQVWEASKVVAGVHNDFI